MKLQYKLFIFFVILLLIFGAVTIIFTSTTLKAGLENRLIEREKIGQEVLEKRVFPYLANKDYVKVTSILFEEKEIKKEAIYYIAVYDINGNILSHTFLNEIPEQVKHRVYSNVESFSANELRINNVPVTDITFVIEEGDYKVGLLSIGYKKEYIENIISQIIRTIVNIIIVLTIFPIILSFFLSRFIVKPVQELAKGMEEVSKGNLDHKIEIKSKDEIGELADVFNRMAQDLQKSNKEILDSEKRYRTLFESAGDAIFIMDGEGEKAGHIVAANHAAAEMHGYSVNELLALNIKDLDTPDAAKEVPGRIQRMLKGERIKAEIPHVKKDGTVFPVEVSAGLLEVGGYKFILAFDRDITERRRAEEALKESEERYRSLFENSPISLWEEDFASVKKYLDDLKNKGVKDTRAYFDKHPEEVALCADMVKVIDVNKTTIQMFKAREKDEIIRGLNKVFTEKSYGVFKEELIALAEGKTTFECEAIVKTLTGNEMYISLRWSEVPGHEKTSSVRLLVSIMDITERKQAEEAIKKYAAKLEESNRLKELFSDVMHHDLLNPLNVAAGYIELLRDEETSPKKIASMERIERNLTKGMELIESATMFSKLESMEKIEFATIDLKEVIERVIEALNPLVTKAGMTVENSIDGSMMVRGNKIIEEVFANFISNAVKYAPKGKKILVEGEDMGEFWRIKVIDFGEGIKDADKAMIFERFRIMEKKGVKGSGLGLAIARKIVELHKGRIWVEDNPEGGAIFVVEIQKLSV